MPRDAFAVPGYWDLPGAYPVPGGGLGVSRSQGGQPRSVSGIDFPVVGYPNTGWYPGMPTGQEIPGAGLPLRGGEVGGGPVPGYSIPTTSSDYPGGSYGAYPAPDMNKPTNEDVLPAIQTLLYRNLRNYGPGSAPGPTPQPIQQGSSAYAAYPDLSNASPVIVDSGGFNAGGENWMTNAYPDLSGLPPVSVTPPGYSGGGGIGGGTGGGSIGSRAQGSNAQFAAFANQMAANAGFGSGLISQGGGGWQGISEVPSGAFGSIGPSNAFGGGGARVFLS